MAQISEPLAKERNDHFHFHSEASRRPLDVGRELAELARRGRLSERIFRQYVSSEADEYSLRDVYTKYASWAVYTTEYLNALAMLLRGKRVVEVGAGRGLLQPLMRERGIDWLSTDKTPPIRLPGYPYVLERAWQRALKPRWAPTAVFMSWWPHDDEDDCAIAQRCVELGIPMVVVGEWQYGCTGTEPFWDAKQPWKVHYRLPDAFQDHDVPQWRGIRDSTYVVCPRAVEPARLLRM